MSSQSRHVTGPSWEIETAGALQRQELPFAIDVVGDFLRASTQVAVPLADRRFVDLTADNFAATLADWRPRLEIALPDAGIAAKSATAITLTFGTIEDFAPAALERQVRTALAEASGGGADPDQLATILGNEELRELEGSLRALAHLATRVSADKRVRLRVLPATKTELAASFRERVDTEQSILFKLVYETNYFQLGGEPCSLLLADYSFGHAPDDVRLLDKLARLATVAMCPVAVAGRASLFGPGSWADLAARGLPAVAYSSRAHSGWRDLRDSGTARHVVVTVPRVRSAVGNGLINGGYAVALRLIETFVATGGMSLAGELRDLGSAEVEFPKELRVALANVGLLPVGQRGAAEPGHLRTLERSKRYYDSEKTRGAAASANLICVLWTLQFGRAVKCITRDRVGSFVDDEQLQAHLDDWLQQYVGSGHGVDGHRPLAEARLEVRNLAGLLRGSGLGTVFLELRPALPGEAFARPVQYELTVPGRFF